MGDAAVGHRTGPGAGLWDGCNDLSLFRAFVHTRAMGNAATPLQALAEQVIEPNTEDGVAREIERLLMKQ